MKSPRTLIAGLLVASLSACNVFSPLDKPSGDAQLLSAARACFDRGDFTCASENYSKLSTGLSSTAAMEQVYKSLDQQGATMGAFATFVGNGADGDALTIFSESISGGAGQSKRMAMFNALATLPYMASPAARTDNQNFAVFVASFSLAGEILAEIAGAHGGVLRQSDITNAAGTMKLHNDSFDATGFNTASPSSDQLYWVIQTAQDALNALSASGSFGGTSAGFGNISAVGRPSQGAIPATRDGIFRAAITSGFGVGR